MGRIEEQRVGMKYIYLLVTDDEYEHIIDFDTRPTMLAKRHGVNVNAVTTGAWHAEHDGRKSRWRRVWTAEEDQL